MIITETENAILEALFHYAIRPEIAWTQKAEAAGMPRRLSDDLRVSGASVVQEIALIWTDQGFQLHPQLRGRRPAQSPDEAHRQFLRCGDPSNRSRVMIPLALWVARVEAIREEWIP